MAAPRFEYDAAVPQTVRGMLSLFVGIAALSSV